MALDRAQGLGAPGAVLNCAAVAGSRRRRAVHPSSTGQLKRAGLSSVTLRANAATAITSGLRRSLWPTSLITDGSASRSGIATTPLGITLATDAGTVVIACRTASA